MNKYPDFPSLTSLLFHKPGSNFRCVARSELETRFLHFVGGAKNVAERISFFPSQLYSTFAKYKEAIDVGSNVILASKSEEKTFNTF